jgi:hypothetical protein
MEPLACPANSSINYTPVSPPRQGEACESIALLHEPARGLTRCHEENEPANRLRSLLKPCVLAVSPTPESALHIAKFTSNFLSTVFLPLETMFCIAKISAYLLEK